MIEDSASENRRDFFSAQFQGMDIHQRERTRQSSLAGPSAIGTSELQMRVRRCGHCEI